MESPQVSEGILGYDRFLDFGISIRFHGLVHHIPRFWRTHREHNRRTRPSERGLVRTRILSRNRSLGQRVHDGGSEGRGIVYPDRYGILVRAGTSRDRERSIGTRVGESGFLRLRKEDSEESEDRKADRIQDHAQIPSITPDG